MRTIKFRAWDGKHKEMKLVDTLLRSGEVMCGDEAFKPDALMQFTGLHDKNDKEVWEGDILKQDIKNEFGSFTRNQIGVMVWHKDGCWAIKYETDSPIEPSGNCPPPEIIGNIYENEDLLK